MPKKLLFCLLLIFVFPFLHAEKQLWPNEYISSYQTTTSKIITAPTHWHSSNWLKAGAVAVIGTGLYFSEEDINTWIQDHKNDTTHSIAQIANHFGDGKLVIPAVLLTYGAAFVLDSPKTQDTALLMGKTLIFAGTVSQFLKITTQQQRPLAHNGHQFWYTGDFSLKNQAFPSGHAMIVFSVAPILASQYRGEKWVAPLVYGIAATTCYARMHDEKHWASNVFVGGAIGYFSAQIVLKTTPRLTISPDWEKRGISFSYQIP